MENKKSTTPSTTIVKPTGASITPKKDLIKQLQFNLEQIKLAELKADLEVSALKHKKLVIEYEIKKANSSGKPVSADTNKGIDELDKL